jgi:sugar fermentation stimulation protein
MPKRAARDPAPLYESRPFKNRALATSTGPAATDGNDVVLFTYERLEPATLLARYKRFLGDVTLGGSAATTVIHVPNTGPMTGLVEHLPAPALLSKSDNPARKYAHTLEWLRPVAGAAWVGTHSAKANAMVARLLALRAIPELLPYGEVRTEVRFGSEKSRVDFWLSPEGGEGPCHCEVKSVSLAEDAEDVSAAYRLEDISYRFQRYPGWLMPAASAPP